MLFFFVYIFLSCIYNASRGFLAPKKVEIIYISILFALSVFDTVSLRDM